MASARRTIRLIAEHLLAAHLWAVIVLCIASLVAGSR